MTLKKSMIIVSYKHILVSMDKLFLEQHKSMNQELHIFFCNNVLNCEPFHNYPCHLVQKTHGIPSMPLAGNHRIFQLSLLDHWESPILASLSGTSHLPDSESKKRDSGPSTHDAFGKSPTFLPTQKNGRSITWIFEGIWICYCWRDVKNTANNGISTISVDAGFLPSTVPFLRYQKKWGQSLVFVLDLPIEDGTVAYKWLSRWYL